VSANKQTDDDKIVSFNKAMENRTEAEIEAEIQSSEGLARVLREAFKVWLTHKPKSAVETRALHWIMFYGGIYFFGFSEELVAVRQLQAEKRADTRAHALRLWDESEPIRTNSTAAVYLKARRVELPPNADAVMRWHSRCPFGKKGKVGCIVSLFRDAVTDKATGIHRTYVYSATSGKAERMALGTIARSAIKLWPLNGSEVLAVGEGIETVLAAVKLGEARPPAWAVTVANNFTKLPVVSGVNQLTILADNDANGISQEAATKLYHIYNRAGRDALIKHPRAVDTDFNDLLRNGAGRDRRAEQDLRRGQHRREGRNPETGQDGGREARPQLHSSQSL
jgi:hypothetical protein